MAYSSLALLCPRLSSLAALFPPALIRALPFFAGDTMPTGLSWPDPSLRSSESESGLAFISFLPGMADSKAKITRSRPRSCDPPCKSEQVSAFLPSSKRLTHAPIAPCLSTISPMQPTIDIQQEIDIRQTFYPINKCLLLSHPTNDRRILKQTLKFCSNSIICQTDCCHYLLCKSQDASQTNCHTTTTTT